MNHDLLITLTAIAIVLILLGLAGYIVVAILRSDLPDPAPVVDVDPLGDATTVLPPAQQAAADAQVGQIEHVGADQEWAAELHRAVTEKPAELPRVRRTLRHDWQDLIDPTIPVLEPTPAYTGRHSEESIEMRIVPPDWSPPIGRARIAAAVDGTEQMDRVQA